MKINFTILFTLIFSFSFSQSIIFDNINSNGGKINDENINITFTIGQPIVGTISNQSNTISQGFQQNYKVEGCTDENACNFDPSANVDNGECIYPSSSEESITVCDSYMWNGQIYTQSGEYTYTTPNSVGCDSVVYLSLIVNYLSTSFSTVEICNEYQWNGELYTESGEYSYSTINQYGCDSTANLSLTIINCGCTDPIANNYNPEATQDDGNCTYCSFDVNIISQNPSTTNFCDGYFAMTPTSGTGPYVYEINGVASTNFFAPACNDIFNIVISDADNCQFEQTLILSDYVGCTDSEALNYDETALFDDDSCIDVVEGCMDENADNYLAEANVDDGNCIFYGCMDQSADNFDETANVDDGSCLYCEINIGALVSQENTSFDCNGYIILSISSSHNPVSIEWDNGMTGGFMSNLCSGDYNYTATDDQGCVLSGTVTVTGTVEGCTDPLACNYQSVADIDNGSCVYLDDLNVAMNTSEMGHTILTWEPLENVSIYKVYKGTSLDNMQFIGSSFEPNFTEAAFNNQSYYYQVSSTVECFGITNEVFSNPVFYNYTSTFSVDVVVTDASCICCNDGAINFTISGGFPPYDINDIGEQNNLAFGEEKIILVSPAFSGALFSETYTIGYDQETYGCMDELAINYDECVTVDDGSCEYENLSACDITPSGLFVDDIIHNRVVFNWSPPTAAPSHYMIRYRPVGSSSWTVMTAGPVNSNEFTGTKRTRYFMQPGTTYQWNIRARNIDDNGTTVCQSPWSASHQFTTLDECPNLVNHFVNTEANWVDFNAFDPESIINVYDSKGKLREVGTNSFRYVNGNTNGIDVRKGNFTPSTDYEWHTKAWCVGNVDDQGNPDPQYHSGWGEFYQFSTQDPCDKMPTNLYTTTNNNQNLITMNWSTPESGAPHHYFLELVNETTGQVFQWNNIAGNATSKTKYNQVPGHEFSWRIRGACGSIGTSWATIFTQPVYYTLGAERISQIEDVYVYPNPTRGKFNLMFEVNNSQDIKVEITSVVGEIISSEVYDDFSGSFIKSFDLTNTSNGMYFVKVYLDNQVITKTITNQ